MRITKQEAENVMNMLASSDKENGYLAFKAIEAHDFSEKEDLGYLIYFYKFSRFTIEDWQDNAPVAAKLLTDIYKDNNLESTPLTYSRALNIMVNNNACKQSIELFLERHVKDLSSSLSALGYPIDKLEFNLKLKE